MAVTGRQILYPAKLVSGRQAAAVNGAMDADQALARLIAAHAIAVSHRGRNIYVLAAGPPPKRRRSQRPGDVQPPRPRALPPLARTDDGGAGTTAIVVTGSNIRSAGVGASPVIVLDAQDIARSGSGTVAEALALLPQNFGGTANEDTSLTGSDRIISNIGLGSSVNLRGLGSDATLTLVNGRRVAGSGGKGDFTDLSTIPTVAVERIEVLTDGASALYGSDAIGGVVNLLLRRDFEGAESRMRLGTVTRGGSQDIQLGQVVGARWSTGHFLAAYEFQHREALSSSSRAYTRSADLRPLGGGDYRQYFSTPGTIVRLDPVSRTYVPIFAIPAGQDGTNLTPANFLPGANLSSPRADVDLLPDQKRHSLYVTGEQAIGDAVTLYAEGRYARRRFTHLAQPSLTVMTVTRANPWFVSPTGAASANIAYLFGEDLGPLQTTGKVDAWSLTGGMRATLGGDWQIDGYAAYARQADRRRNDNILNATALNEALGTTPDDPLTPFSTARDGFFNPYGEGHSNSQAITDFIGSGFITERYHSSLLNGSLLADGTLIEGPGGPIKLALGAQGRREDFSRATATFVSGRAPTAGMPIKAERTILALFGELAIPLIGSGNARAGIQRLDASIAVRGERYSDFGSTLNPKLGLSWEPVRGLTLRGSFGTSFRAPALLEVRDAFRVSYTQLPASGGGNVQVLSMRGGNVDLEPEKATSFTLGMKLAPPELPGFTAEASYFETRFRNRIGQPANENILQALTDPIYAPFVTLIDPANSAQDRATVVALINGPGSSVPVTLDPTAFRAIVDGRYVNAARVDIRGLDFLVRQSLALGRHRLSLSANMSVMIDYKDQLTPASPMIERVGTLGNPVDLRARTTADWSHGDVGATVSVNHVGRYTDNISVPVRPIAAWSGVDLQLRYEPSKATDWRKGLSLSLSIQNLFDRDPPFVDRSLGFAYDPANADVLGRFIALQMKKRW